MATVTLLAFLLTLALLTPSGKSWDTLYTNGVLAPGYALYQGLYTLIMQQDCNLVLYDIDQAVWSSRTDNKGKDCYARMQEDGNFVLYDGNNRALWASNTNKGPGYYKLVLQKDRNLVIYGGGAQWATRTNKVTSGDAAAMNATAETGAGEIAMVTEEVAV